MDFTFKEVTVNTHYIREETMTFTREELALMVERAGLELSKVQETLEAKLAQKEQETIRLRQVQNPPPNNTKMEAQLNKLSHDVQGLSQRLNPLCKGNRISHFLLHLELINNKNAASNFSNDQCPMCYKLFDRWSGYFMLPC